MEYVTHLPEEDPSIATTSTYGLQFTYPVKYYDFHVYYYAHNEESDKEAKSLLNKLLNDFPEDSANGSIIVKDYLIQKLLDHTLLNSGRPMF